MLAGGERKEDGQCYYLFFFQAEDGIRDLYVTEVQTCALPISEQRRDRARLGQQRLRAAHVRIVRGAGAHVGSGERDGEQQREQPGADVVDDDRGEPALAQRRSEERRVGKEWRLRVATRQGK